MSRAYKDRKALRILFKLTKEPNLIAEELDEKFPVKVTHNKDLISRVSERYPSLPSFKVALIVKEFFKVMRTNMLSNNIINLDKLFLGVRYHFTNFASSSAKPDIKVKGSMPLRLRRVKFGKPWTIIQKNRRRI